MKKKIVALAVLFVTLFTVSVAGAWNQVHWPTYWKIQSIGGGGGVVREMNRHMLK